MPQSSLLRGTLILSVAIFLTKFLGLIFVIPLTAIIGEKGMALYTYSYIPYTIILSFATLGVPMAVSKFVSKYNAIGDFHTGRRLFRSGLLLMSLSGIVAFLFLYFLAPEIASLSGQFHSQTGNNLDEVIMVIRMVSLALIVVPGMSLFRGYFQGFQSMGPTAVSQIVEQILRILFALLAALVVMSIFHGGQATAAGMATFAAFIGALGSLVVLIWYWMKRKNHLDKQLKESHLDSKIPLKDMYVELIAYAVPFVAIGLAVPLYQLVDQFTINHALTSIGWKQAKAATVFTSLDQLDHKLILIPVSLSMALATTLVPTITSSFSTGNYRTMNKQITQAFQIVLFLTVPAAVGLSILSYPVYETLYANTNLQIGGEILRWYAPTALLFSLFSITASILQGINQQKFVLFSLLVGLLIKLLLNTWFITLFHGIGAILATDIGFCITLFLNVMVIRAYAGYQLMFISKRALLIVIFSAAMAVIVWLVTMPFTSLAKPPETWMGSAGILTLGVIIGGAVYIGLAMRLNLFQQIFGDRFSFLNRKKRASQ